MKREKVMLVLRERNALVSDAEQSLETKKKIEGKREKWERGRRNKGKGKKKKTEGKRNCRQKVLFINSV